MKQFAIAAALVLFASTGYAGGHEQAGNAASDSGWRIYAGAAFSDYDGDTTGVDDSTVGLKLGAQYRFNSWFGLEGAYTNSGDFEQDITANTPGGNTEISFRGLSVWGIGYLPLVEDIDVYGKIGYFDFDTDLATDGFISQSAHTDGLALGVGATINIDDNLGIKADFDWYDAEEADLWAVILGLEYRF